MTQTVPTSIDTSVKTGTTLGIDLNAWLDTIKSSHFGSSRPAYATRGFVWSKDVSTTETALFFYDGTIDTKIISYDTILGIVSGGGDMLASNDLSEVTPATAKANLGIPKSNFTATANPVVTDDSGSGYGVGSEWVNVTLDTTFRCVDASAGAAVWSALDAVGGGGTVAQVAGAKLTTTLLVTSASDTVTGLKTSLTPASAASDILVRVSAIIGGDFWNVVPKVSIYRSIGGAAATKVWPSASGQYIVNQYLADAQANSALITYSCPMEFIDSPATTSSVEYEMRIASNGTNNACVNRRNDGIQRGESFIVLEELT